MDGPIAAIPPPLAESALRPLLSICIPTFQRPELLELALEFWIRELAAHASDTELIVGDNGACDRTRAICDRAAALAPVRYVRHERNLIFNGNVQRLLERHVAGQWVWICGDDDFVHRGAVAEILDVLRSPSAPDYCYVNTRSISTCELTAGERADIASSPRAILANADTVDRAMRHVAEIVSLDRACFTGIYSSIWRRTEALAAFAGSESLTAFESLEGTFPHAVYLARRMLDRPCYYFGEPLMTVSHVIRWNRFVPLFSLHWMPAHYDLLQARGIPASALEPHRRAQLHGAWGKLAQLWSNRANPHGHPFSFVRFVGRHWRYREFWMIVPRVLLKTTIARRLRGEKCLPSSST